MTYRALSLFVSIWLALAICGCAPTLAQRLKRKAGKLDCRDARGVPVVCPQPWP